jgi:hypothetical protein
VFFFPHLHAPAPVKPSMQNCSMNYIENRPQKRKEKTSTVKLQVMNYGVVKLYVRLSHDKKVQREHKEFLQKSSTKKWSTQRLILPDVIGPNENYYFQ